MERLSRRFRYLFAQVFSDRISISFAKNCLPLSGNLSRAEVINHIIGELGAKNYLEIGVNTPNQPGYSRDLVRAEVRHGVDPNPNTAADFVMTSDEYFAAHCQTLYDVIFIDGLHQFEQAYKDILNSFDNLSENGVVIVHDTRPVSPSTATRCHGHANKWHGDVWRAIVLLRLSHPQYNLMTVDTDEGVTLIWRCCQSNLVGLPKGDPFSWTFFQAHHRSLLNVVSVDEFFHQVHGNPPY